MKALAIIEIHPAIAGTPQFEEYRFNSEWFTILNIGTEPILLNGLYIKIKTSYSGKGFEISLSPQNPAVEIKKGQKCRFFAGGAKDPSPREQGIIRYYLGRNDYFLNETADIILIYESHDDFNSGKAPFTQMLYYTELDTSSDDEIPF